MLKKRIKNSNLTKIVFMGIVVAVVIFNHGLKFGIIFLVSDYAMCSPTRITVKLLTLSNTLLFLK